jgi:hypothetical protein
MYFFHKFDFFSRPKVRPKPKHNRNTVSQKISGVSHKREILPKKRDSSLKDDFLHLPAGKKVSVINVSGQLFQDHST